MRWLLIIGMLIANAAVVLTTAGPSLVTRVPRVPDGIACEACATPQIQNALVASAEAGRSEMYGAFRKAALLAAAVGLLNVGLIAFLVLRPAKRGGASHEV